MPESNLYFDDPADRLPVAEGKGRGLVLLRKTSR